MIQVVANKLSKTNRSIHISSIDGARSDRHLLGGVLSRMFVVARTAGNARKRTCPTLRPWSGSRCGERSLQRSTVELNPQLFEFQDSCDGKVVAWVSTIKRDSVDRGRFNGDVTRGCDPVNPCSVGSSLKTVKCSRRFVAVRVRTRVSIHEWGFTGSG